MKISIFLLLILINTALHGENLWVDAKNLCVEGRGWTSGITDFSRLPDKYQSVVSPEVWTQSRQSSGITVRFVVTGTTFVDVKWKIPESKSMNYVTYQTINGVDLYCKRFNKWVYAGVGKPLNTSLEQNVTLKSGLRASETYEFMLYLPLYNGIVSLELGFSEGATVEPALPHPNKPIVCYGTSILQGASATRPGLSYPSQLARKFNTSAINFGFSKNGLMEESFGEIMGEIDASVYLIDCLSDMETMSLQEITNRTLALVRKLRTLRPATPIILVEDRTSVDYFFDDIPTSNNVYRKALKSAYDILVNETNNLYYIDGDLIFAGNSEATSDGSNPSDLGLYMYSLACEAVIEDIGLFEESELSGSYQLSADGKTLEKWTGSETDIDMNSDTRLKEVTSIAANAFKDNTTLQTLKVGSKVTSIGVTCFQSSKLKTITWGSSLTSFGSAAFNLCANLEVISDLPASMTNIPGRLFRGCKKLTNINIPSAVTSVGYAAFESCQALQSLDFSQTQLDSVAYLAFNACTSLKTITFPSTLRVMDNAVFRLCTALENITVNAINPPTLSGVGVSSFITAPDQVFTGSVAGSSVPLATCILKVPQESVVLYEGADQWQDFNHIVGISASVFQNIHDKAGFKIYNIDGQFQIESTSLARGAVLKVFDMNGTGIYTTIMDENPHIFNLKKGMYILKLGDEIQKLALY